MDKVTTAFPLPPNYFIDMTVEEVQRMEPPKKSGGVALFGMAITNDDGVPILTSDQISNRADPEAIDISSMSHEQKVNTLKQLKSAIFANYLQILDLMSRGITDESLREAMQDFKKANLHIMYILADLCKLQEMTTLKERLHFVTETTSKK